jgi:hypothetical protein
MNHCAFSTASQALVAAAATCLTERRVKLLFDTSRHRPEVAQRDADPSDQVLFESPDRMVLGISTPGRHRFHRPSGTRIALLGTNRADHQPPSR